MQWLEFTLYKPAYNFLFLFVYYVMYYSDYKGWTCLHHAASAGYTQTMEILLSANLKLLDKTDEDGVWMFNIKQIRN